MPLVPVLAEMQLWGMGFRIEVCKQHQDELMKRGTVYLECSVKLPQKATSKRKSAQVNSTSKKVIATTSLLMSFDSDMLTMIAGSQHYQRRTSFTRSHSGASENNVDDNKVYHCIT
eukprot:TRINITY_DN2006_c0_g1_i27.p1 TRINITY_DN2006_c0_g1~~TRINITY_DN2006_c0_g1_i27.p1  ORF type:complete len:116 (-),score=10.76 TRINITY_DN2006_c0_g1_i27:759-1106(-)